MTTDLEAAAYAAIDRMIAEYRGPLDRWPDEDDEPPVTPACRASASALPG